MVYVNSFCFTVVANKHFLIHCFQNTKYIIVQYALLIIENTTYQITLNLMVFSFLSVSPEGTVERHVHGTIEV